MGPRELFYADIFASRETGCRSTLGMPGVRDRHAGCVGEYLVRHDLFDFLLLSLPDNDNHSHRLGPDAQVAAIAQADRQLARLFEAAGGSRRVPRRPRRDRRRRPRPHAGRAHGLAGGARSPTSTSAARPTCAPLEASQIALCPAQRAAMVYVFGGRRCSSACWRGRGASTASTTSSGARTARPSSRAGRRALRFAPGDEVGRPARAALALAGDLDVLGLALRRGVLAAASSRTRSGGSGTRLGCASAGRGAADGRRGVEFTDWGGADHVGGGSHGSLSAGDSHAPLICCGLDGDARARRQWSIADVAPLVTAHFGV